MESTTVASVTTSSLPSVISMAKEVPKKVGIPHPAFPDEFRLTIDDVGCLKNKLFQQARASQPYQTAIQRILTDRKQAHTLPIFTAISTYPIIETMNAEKKLIAVSAYRLLMYEVNWSEFQSEVAAELSLSGTIGLTPSANGDAYELLLQWIPWT